MASRALRFKPPLIALGVAVAAVFAGYFLFGLPGPCSDGGLLTNALQDHQALQDSGAAFSIFGGIAVRFLSMVWILAAAVARGIERLNHPADAPETTIRQTL